MWKRLIVKAGDTFCRLTVIGEDLTSQGRRLKYLCRCACGNYTRANSSSLYSGRSKSCGCWNREQRSLRGVTHGMSRSPEYRVWTNMIQRCTNPARKAYPDYGGRGITVCESWTNSFVSFLDSMGNRPGLAFTLDRIDNSKGYGPGNCRWATRKEQAANKRNSAIVRHAGRKMLIQDLAETCGISYFSLYKRIKRGESAASAISRPAQFRVMGKAKDKSQ